MTRNTEEERLAREFGALRGRVEGSGAIPDFQAMVRQARSDAAGTPAVGAADDVAPPALRIEGGRRGGRTRDARWIRWTPLAAAAAAAGLLFLARGDAGSDAEFERLVADYTKTMAAATLRSPTASLMKIPGIDLGAVPSFGTYRSAPPTPEEPQERNR